MGLVETGVYKVPSSLIFFPIPFLSFYDFLPQLLSKILISPPPPPPGLKSNIEWPLVPFSHRSMVGTTRQGYIFSILPHPLEGGKYEIIIFLGKYIMKGKRKEGEKKETKGKKWEKKPIRGRIMTSDT